MTGRYRATTWMAFADFFTALALVSFALYASHRSRADQVIQIQDDVRRLSEALTQELRRQGIPAESRPQDFSIVLPALLFFDSGRAEIVDASRLTKVAYALKK